PSRCKQYGHLQSFFEQSSRIENMSQPRPSQPNPAIQRLYREADEAWADLDYRKSLGLMEKAIRKDPRNPSMYLHVARGYGRRYDFPAAQRYIDRALQVSTDRTHTLGDAGRICMEFDQLDMAIDYLARAGQN